jgi:hypothetical protein
MGGDARIVLIDRCLLCLGAVDREAHGRSYLASPDVEAAALNRAIHAPAAWRTERRGSSHSLNALTAAAGLKMLEDAAAGIIAASTWCQINLDDRGRITTEYPLPRRPAPGQCACHLRGSGDAGLREFLAVLNRRAAV